MTGGVPLTGGVKYDGGKLRWSLLPWGGMRSVLEVLEYGARKYAPENWRKVAEARVRYADAMQRHLAEHMAGRYRDHESGLPHVAHAVCCGLFILALTGEQ